MDNDSGLDFVPPSPIAASTQLSQIQDRDRLPPLPRLPGLDASIDLELDIPSGSGEVTGTRPQLEEIHVPGQGTSISDNASSANSSNVNIDVNDPDVRPTRLRDSVFRLQRHNPSVSEESAAVNVEEIEIESGDSDGDTGTNSEVIEIDSDVEAVSDSDEGEIEILNEDPASVSRPPNPEPPEDVPENADAVEEVVVEAEEAAAGDEEPGQGTSSSSSSSSAQVPAPVVSPVPDPSPASARVHATPVSVVVQIQGESPADFRSPKRRRIASPEKPAEPTKETSKVDEEDDEGDCCPICFENWTTSGVHRLCSLRCGHLFGQSCIEKWLKGQGGKCPHCNAKAKRQDIRVLFAKTIKALDTSERDRALKDLENEKEARRRIEMEGAQLRLQYQMAVEETNKLRLELENLKAQIRRGGVQVSAGTSAGAVSMADLKSSSQRQLSGQFILDKTIKIWDAGNCRVMAYCQSLATLAVSQPSTSPLFPGFGVKKISSLDFKTSQYQTIHSKAIRDLAFHPTVEDGMLLSCGLDKKVKMTSLLSNTVVQSYDTPVPAWSCVWNAENRNYFYAGLQNGLVLEFDIRNTTDPTQELNKEGNRSPVASLQFMGKDRQADFRSGGLLIGQLDRVSFFEYLDNDQQRLHILPLEGSLTSLCVESSTRHILASYRPTARHPTIRHQLCEMLCRNISADPTTVDNVCSCNVVHTFHGGRTQTVLSKTLVLHHPQDNNRLLIVAGDEASSSVHVWDSGTTQLKQRLMTGGVVVDLTTFTVNNVTYLAALTDKQVKVFKWT